MTAWPFSDSTLKLLVRAGKIKKATTVTLEPLSCQKMQSMKVAFRWYLQQLKKCKASHINRQKINDELQLEAEQISKL